MNTNRIETDMNMTYELITPEIAADLLETNDNNRKISVGQVEAFATDITNNNWDETVSSAIAIDKDGKLRDGQHRLAAIVMAGIGVKMWVCRNVSSDGIYDNNRKRSQADQISILRSDLNNVYKTTRYIAVARAIIIHNSPHKHGAGRRTVSPKEIIDFTDAHKEILDGFFLNISQASVSKISLAVVHLALFMAFASGTSIDTISEFYEVLCTGMSTKPEEFPIIAYRNYLKDNVVSGTLLADICRCQYALKKYINGSCIKRSLSPEKLIYPYPFEKVEEEN